jgi:hypothetical protein
MDSTLCVEIMDMDPQYVYAFSSYTELRKDRRSIKKSCDRLYFLLTYKRIT